MLYEWVLQSIGLLVAAFFGRYILGAAAIYFKTRFPEKQDFGHCLAEQVFTQASDNFLTAHEVLLRHNFDMFRCGIHQNEHCQIRYALYLHREKGVYSTLTTTRSRYSHTSQLAFHRTFLNGEVIAVTNSDIGSILPGRCAKSVYYFFDINDSEELMSIMFRILQRHANGKQVTEIVRGNEYDDYSRIDMLEREYQLQKGWIKFDAGKNCFVYTLAGAIVTTFRMTWPGRFILARIFRQESKQLLHEIGG